MNNKISTSIQYQFSNVKLFNEIFYNFSVFNEHLNKGPEHMKEYLLNTWNELRDNLIKNDKVELKDINKSVNISDFDVTFNRSKNNVPIFYFTMPDYEYEDAASKYVALCLTPNIPRYFTLEYTFGGKFVIGEFILEEKGVSHRNYGIIDNNRLSYFAGVVLDIIEK